MSSCVLDSSAVLVLVQREPGFETVAGFFSTAAISTVNLAEVASKLADKGLLSAELRNLLQQLNLEIIDFDEELSYLVADLREATRATGLSLGDRACLATAKKLGVRAVTADRKWGQLKVGVEVQIVR